jgi:hypothetical protein
LRVTMSPICSRLILKDGDLRETWHPPSTVDGHDCGDGK